MGHFLLASLLCLGVAVLGTSGQSCPATTCYFEDVVSLAPTQADRNRYFVIGGLFDMRVRGNNPIECGTAWTDEGIISQLAFFWGIRQYSGPITQRGVSIGAVAYDNCQRPEQTLENILGFAQCKINIQSMTQQNLVAYVGPYSSEDLSSAAQLATEIGVTLISPTANAANLDLSETRTLRVNPSIQYEADAMLHFLDQVNSDYLIILYSAGDPFWHAAYMALKDRLEASSRKICVTFHANIDDYMDNLQDFVADEMEDYVDQRYVIPLMPRDYLDRLLKAISRNNEVTGRLRFILSSAIGADLTLFTQNGNAGKDGIVLSKQDVSNTFSTANLQLDQFKDYIARGAVDDVNGMTNNWLDTYKAAYGQLPALSADGGNRLEDIAARTLLSVKVIIEGMDNILAECGNQFCDQFRNLNLDGSIRYERFRDSFSIFDSEGGLRNSRIGYSYLHFENPIGSGSGVRFNSVGNFTYNNGWVARVEDLSAPQYLNMFAPPVCVGDFCCVEPTTPAPVTQAPTTPAPTQGPDVTTEKTYSEVRYRKGQAITGAYPADSSQDNRETYGTRFDQGHRWVLALGVLAGLGILCVLIFEIYILYKLLGTRLGHKWRTMWLGQLLLFGIFLAYLVLFAYIFVPTKATCGITRFGVGVSYAVCFAVLLVKLMVILTSKSSDVLLPGDESPNYLKGIYQFLMFIFAVGVQIVIDVQWLITVPPEAVQVKSNTGDLVWVCNHYTWEAGLGMDDMSTMVRTNFENHIMSLIYIMVMILITTILSLNAHGIITNHRESVFIGIAAGFSIPIWLAWTLVGGLNNDHDYAQEFGDACIAFGLFLTVTLILFAMFLPKVRQLVNMGVEGIYLEDDRDTYYAGSVIMAPPSYKSKGPGSVIYVNNNQGIYSEPVVISNGDPNATHLKHPGSTYSAPPGYLKRPESNYGGSTRVLRVTDDLKGRHPQKRPQSEVAYGTAGRPRSTKGTLTRSRSQDLGAL